MRPSASFTTAALCLPMGLLSATQATQFSSSSFFMFSSFVTASRQPSSTSVRSTSSPLFQAPTATKHLQSGDGDKCILERLRGGARGRRTVLRNQETKTVLLAFGSRLCFEASAQCFRDGSGWSFDTQNTLIEESHSNSASRIPVPSTANFSSLSVDQQHTGWIVEFILLCVATLVKSTQCRMCRIQYHFGSDATNLVSSSAVDASPVALDQEIVASDQSDLNFTAAVLFTGIARDLDQVDHHQSPCFYYNFRT